ncbi:MAG: DUF1624 domain-containing protein [bacterium]|nr:DUF1624 domain-containing protein [bacterium]
MAGKQRFEFIDQFRGLIGVMMALGHSNYYFNAAWLSLDPLDPFFDNFGQFALRYMGYLCAPGFLMMNGAMMYNSYWRRVAGGESPGRARWDFIQRGLFLVAVQLIWVNASWGGFERLRLEHFGIIATIGTSMLLLAIMVRWRWQWRLAVAVVVSLVHPLLLRIPYDAKAWTHVPMQLFIDSGDFNKYPVLPWFALATLGSVMAHFWFEAWRDGAQRARRSLALGAALIVAAWGLRLWGGSYANIFPAGKFFELVVLPGAEVPAQPEPPGVVRRRGDLHGGPVLPDRPAHARAAALRHRRTGAAVLLRRAHPAAGDLHAAAAGPVPQGRGAGVVRRARGAAGGHAAAGLVVRRGEEAVAQLVRQDDLADQMI